MVSERRFQAQALGAESKDAIKFDVQSTGALLSKVHIHRRYRPEAGNIERAGETVCEYHLQ